MLCRGGLADIPRLNLNLRCGARVLLSRGRVQARSFEELFEGCAALPWEDFIPREGRFPVKGYAVSSQLRSVPACQSILKKALCKRLGQVYGLEILPETGSLYQVQFSILKDQVTLMLDTSGDSLYKRGYRAQNMGRAPAGDAGGGHGPSLPLPGQGCFGRPLLRQRDYPH